jgi:hypothetical protein
MAGRSQMIAGPGHPDLERSPPTLGLGIRRAFELSQRGLITCCGFHLRPIQATSVGTGLCTVDSHSEARQARNYVENANGRHNGT